MLTLLLWLLLRLTADAGACHYSGLLLLLLLLLAGVVAVAVAAAVVAAAVAVAVAVFLSGKTQQYKHLHE